MMRLKLGSQKVSVIETDINSNIWVEPSDGYTITSIESNPRLQYLLRGFPIPYYYSIHNDFAKQRSITPCHH